jgi:membrane protease subunit HflC
MKNNLARSLFLIAAVLLLAYLSVFTVYESNRALVSRLGNLVSNQGVPVVFGPGLHFKIPLISQVVQFDKRLQTLEIQDSRIVTANKKDVIVNSFIKWRINDFAKFYKATNGDVHRAEVLLEQKINDGLRAEFGKRSITDVVSGERTDIMQILLNELDASAKGLGINVVDVRVKRIDLPLDVSGSVYERMRAERHQVAEEHRATGQRDAEKIKAEADARRTVIIATAESESKRLRGEGEGKAAKIYAEAYNQDPEFYSFYRSLLAYEQSFKDKSDILVVKPDNDFFKYFNKKK